MPTPTSIVTGPRTYPRVKFVWGASDTIAARWRLGLFGFYERSHGFPDSGLAISLRGLLRWAVVLAVAGYFGGAALLTRWFERQPHNQIKFSDVLTWPARREHVTQLRGRAWLAQGRDALKARQWAEAVFYLRRGLDVCPDDFDARLALAQFYQLGGERTRALALLVEGPLHGLPPPGWREAFFKLTEAGEDWATALQFCERCLPQLRAPGQWAERQQMLARQCAALRGLGRATEALALAEAEGEAAAGPVKLEHALALLALDRAGDAADFLARERAVASATGQAPLLQLQARALREAGRLDAMERVLADLRALAPAQPEPVVFALEQRARAHRAAAAALDDFIFRFGGTPANLQLALQSLAEVPDVPLVRRIGAADDERGYAPRPFRVSLAMALLRQGDFEELARVVAGNAPSFATADPEAKLWFAWIQNLSAALASPATGAQAQLIAFLQTHLTSLESHRLTLVALQRAGRDETARDALALARKLYPESPTLRALQPGVDRALAPAATVAMQSPSSASSAARVPETWEAFLPPLDAALAAQRWPEAQQLIHAARFARPTPDWLETHDADLRWRDARIAQATHDLNALRAALNLYLDGSATRAAIAVQFARELHAAGANDDAILVLRAVLQKSFDHPLATNLLAEWRQRPAK